MSSEQLELEVILNFFQLLAEINTSKFDTNKGLFDPQTIENLKL